MKPLFALSVASSLLLLSACSSGTVKNTLGLERSAPDEFRVVSRPPLSVPPQFNLEPPDATAQSPNQQPASEQAQSLIQSDEPAAPAKSKKTKKTAKASASTQADSQFLKNIGADQADPTIRHSLTEERVVKQEAEEDHSWWNVFSSNPPKKDPVVDAKKEADRIQTNESAGKPVTEGDTPTEKQRDTGVLGRIFGY